MVGELISLGRCVSQVEECISRGKWSSRVGKHILLEIHVSQVGEHISLGICVSWAGEHISQGICVPQVDKVLYKKEHIDHDFNNFFFLLFDYFFNCPFFSLLSNNLQVAKTLW